MRKFLPVLVLCELFIIIFVGVAIYQKKGGVINVNFLSKKNYATSKKDGLKYYYEPRPNTVEHIDPLIPIKATATINSDGLNERFDYPIEKAQTTFRIVTLGDSFTYGFYVDTKDNWSELLEDRLNTLDCFPKTHYEVINLGVPGYDIRYEVERFRTKGQKYNPDLVLWLLNQEDFIQNNELMLPERDRVKSDMLKKNNYLTLVRDGHFFPEWAQAEINLIQKYGDTNLLKITMGQIPEVRKYFSGKIIFLTFPSVPSDYIHALKQVVLSNPPMLFFNGLVNLDKRTDLRIQNDIHPNQKGHALIAEEIFNYLKKSKIIECKK